MKAIDARVDNQYMELEFPSMFFSCTNRMQSKKPMQQGKSKVIRFCKAKPMPNRIQLQILSF